MDVLFLDFDGVLNTWAWRSEMSPKVLKETGGERRLYRMSLLLDPAAVARVNRIVTETGALVVASTAWRHFFDDPCKSLTEILRHAGATFAVGDFTLSRMSMQDRESEIVAWLREHDWPLHIALDDVPMRVRSILTDDRKGLTDAQADEAIRILRGEP